MRNVTGWLERSCRAPLTGAQAYREQDLFSFYVHRSVGVPPAPEGSVFEGRDIDKRCARSTTAYGCRPRCRRALCCTVLRAMHFAAFGYGTWHTVAHRTAQPLPAAVQLTWQPSVVRCIRGHASDRVC